MRRLLATLVVALSAMAPRAAAADTLEPSEWPAELGLGSAPNALRFGGADRYDTARAAALALRGTGSFPFDSADRTTAAWWGAATCPKSIIVVAGDTPADALAAASLSDPSNRGDEPRLRRVAAADPFFDPPDELDRVDTDSAPIIVTTAGRSGARGLAAAARAAAADLRSGGCTTAREAVIVGGEAAVPVEVEAELVTLGYEEVFRVAGADRYDTAARIAMALGTEAAPAGGDCLDERSDDGSSALGFYGNAVIEYRPTATSCQLQGRSVLLADGSVGADALAAGWWTSFWQVPVLLVNGDGSLPAATRQALQTLAIDSIVVLGGTARISESVVDEAERLSTSVAGRFAGRDRYETSVASARVFGGWYPTEDGSDFAGDRLCLAASSGATVGWPDALTAGPWCGRLGHLAGSRRAPSRMLEPVDGGSTVMIPVRPAHDAAPVLLVPGGGLPTQPVLDLLNGAFSGADQWCVGATTLGCESPGFVVAFGGSGVVADGALETISAALSGGDQAQRGRDAVLSAPFRTALDLSPVYLRGDATGSAQGCIDRDGVDGARWLAVYGETTLVTFRSSLDLTASGTYAGGASKPTCMALAEGTSTMVAVSAAGRRSEIHVLRGETDRAITMSDEVVHPAPRSSGGAAGSALEPGAESSWRFENDPDTPLQVSNRGRTIAVEEARAQLFLAQGGGDVPHRFFAELELDELVGQATGEAVLEGGSWQLAGRVRLPGAVGGFRATLDTRGTPENDDDVLTWRMDAVRP